MITRAIGATAGASYPLGRISMRLLAGSPDTNGTFALGEFSGGPGTWTIPHVHRACEESFFVLDGSFTFTVGDEAIPAGAGAFLLVPRGERHTIRADAEHGRFLTLWTPGGLEEMFIELSRLPTDSLQDPEVRRALASRFDSIPV
ncbi:MAG: cupin domain-containing protein [Chloroflexi bacterium]|nr:cupin domain-containing protein [Chloroflexota bacterium]